MIRRWNEYFLIKKSGLFDAHYYLQQNKDVRRSDVNPLMHYIKLGWKEGRNPSEQFDTGFYLSTYPDVKKAGINPCIHFLRYGKSEGRKPRRYSVAESGRGSPDINLGNKLQNSSSNKISFKLIKIAKTIYHKLPIPESIRFKLTEIVNQRFPEIAADSKYIIIRSRNMETNTYGDQLLSLPFMQENLFPYGLQFPSYYGQLFKNQPFNRHSDLIDPPWYVNRAEKRIGQISKLTVKRETQDNSKLLIVSLVDKNIPAHFLNGMINSVILQSYNSWQFHIFLNKNGTWNADILDMQYQEIAEEKIIFHNVDFSENILSFMYETFSILEIDYFIFLNPYDELDSNSLSVLGKEITCCDAELFYSKMKNLQMSEEKFSDKSASNIEIPFGQLAAIKKEAVLSKLSARSDDNSKATFYSFFSELIEESVNKNILRIGEENYIFRRIPGRNIITIIEEDLGINIKEGVLPLRLVVDARLMHRKMTGTERYIIEILKNLSQIRNEYHLIIKAITHEESTKPIEGVEFVTQRHAEEILNSHVFHKTFPASDYETLSEIALAPSVTFLPLDLIAFNNPDYFLDEKNYFAYRQNIRLASKLSDRIIAISNHGKSEIETLLNIPSHKIKTIYLGIQMELFNEKSPVNVNELVKLKIPKDYYLFIGTDYPHKNLITLLNALRLIVNEIPDASLVIVGAHYYIRPQPEINAAMKYLGDRVIHLGHVSDELLTSLYRQAKALVFPSLYEGFGLPILEAMAVGTPVIATRNTSIPEVCGNAALLFNGHDAQELAELMIRVWSNEELRQNLIELGFANVKRFSWEETAKQTVSIYRESVDNSLALSLYQKFQQKRRVIKSLSQNRPTVLIVTHIRFYPPTAGNEQRLFKLVKYLKKIGYQVLMLVNPFMEKEPIDNQRRREMHQFVDYYEELSDYPTERYVQNGTVSPKNQRVSLEKWKSIEYSFCPDELLAKVKRLVNIFSPKIFIAEYIWTSRIFELAEKDILKVIDLVDLFSQKKDRVIRFGIKDDLAMTQDEELEFVNRGDLALAIQDNEAETLRELKPSCEVISAGIDYKNLIAIATQESKKSILIVGSDNQINRLCVNEFLINAWPQIIKNCPDFVLKIVGKVGNTIQGIHHNVELIPFIEQLDSVYRDATIVINPVYAGTGLKIKSVEALGYGKALITWPEGVAGIKVNIDSPPFTVIDSWESLVNKAIELLTNDIKRVALEQLAIEYAKNNLADTQVYRQVGDRFDIHTKREMKILCLYLRYGANDYPGSFEKLMEWYQDKQQAANVDLSVWIIDNKIDKEYDGVDVVSGFRLISGDNSQREFSGFQKVIEKFRDEIELYDVIHFVTSAFNQLYTKYLEYFDLSHLYPILHRPIWLGHIDTFDQPISLLGSISQSWIRTCFFFLSPLNLYALNDINYLRDKSKFFDKNSKLLNNGNIDDVYKKYLQEWLYGEQLQGMTWHGKIKSDGEFEDKALSILNEHMMSIRLRSNGVNLIDYYWLMKNIDIIETTYNYPVPESMEQVKFRQNSLFNI